MLTLKNTSVMNFENAIKREGKSKWGFYIYRHLLDQEKERLGIG